MINIYFNKKSNHKGCLIGKRSLLLFLFLNVKEDNDMKRKERVKEGIMPLIIPEKFNCDALEDDITEFLSSTKRNKQLYCCH